MLKASINNMQIIKLLLGAIDASYDSKDEKSNGPQGGHPPGQYGGPQQQQVPSYESFTASARPMADWLQSDG